MTYLGRYRRKTAGRDPRKVYLILCEGKRTEPDYFQAFSYDERKYFLRIEGLGRSTSSLVRTAREYILDAKRERQKYEQVWCVFDKDESPDADFNSAVQMANAAGIRCAYSNEAFELWFVLHFEYWQTASSRHDYCSKLNALLPGHGGYCKTRPDMFELLKDRQTTALRNAKRLYDSYPAGAAPAAKNPVTTVFELVEQLNSLQPAMRTKGTP